LSDKWIPGDHYFIDDQTGVKTRASQSALQWNGMLVDLKNFEPRQPQDFVRGLPDNMTVPRPRPRPIDTFIGPLDTEIAVAASAGDTTIEVLSTTRMSVNDRLSIMLDDGSTFLTTIFSILSASQLQINTPLSFSAASGQKVYDNTAMSEPTLP